MNELSEAQRMICTVCKKKVKFGVAHIPRDNSGYKVFHIWCYS